jgi:UrcA family protein
MARGNGRGKWVGPGVTGVMSLFSAARIDRGCRISAAQSGKIMKRQISLALASIVALAFVTVSPAAADTPRRASLSYAELNLNSDAGAQVLERRIRYAARQACGFRRGPMDLYERAEIRRCMRDAIAQGTSEVAALRDSRAVALASAS